jgi:hypothetical protein
LQLVAQEGWAAELPDTIGTGNNDSQPLLLSLRFVK